MNKCVFIICWFGPLPTYFDVWLRSVNKNPDFDFFIFSDSSYDKDLPRNVRIIPFTLNDFNQKATEKLGYKIEITKPYRICNFRPMFGLIFSEYIKDFEFWGYCDIDLVFGHLSDFITYKMLSKNDAIFNQGHLSILRNCNELNTLFMKDGSLFPYTTVISKDAVFAFDENTGIQRIAKKNKVHAVYRIPFVDVDTRYTQLTARNLLDNPQKQAYYWENGDLYRCKISNDKVVFQNIAYIHMQKRVINNYKVSKESFWVCPYGYIDKNYIGQPRLKDIIEKNPYDGEQNRTEMLKKYRKRKIMELLERTPYQIYVRIKQEIGGINDNDSSTEYKEWFDYAKE